MQSQLQKKTVPSLQAKTYYGFSACRKRNPQVREFPRNGSDFLICFPHVVLPSDFWAHLDKCTTPHQPYPAGMTQVFTFNSILKFHLPFRSLPGRSGPQATKPRRTPSSGARGSLWTQGLSCHVPRERRLTLFICPAESGSPLLFIKQPGAALPRDPSPAGFSFQALSRHPGSAPFRCDLP